MAAQQNTPREYILMYVVFMYVSKYINIEWKSFAKVNNSGKKKYEN